MVILLISYILNNRIEVKNEKHRIKSYDKSKTLSDDKKGNRVKVIETLAGPYKKKNTIFIDQTASITVDRYL